MDGVGAIFSIVRGAGELLPLAEQATGTEITILGLSSVFVAMTALMLVVSLFNRINEAREAREARARGEEASEPRGSGAPATSEGVPPAATDDDEQTRIAVAISLAITLATQHSSAAVAYRVDGQADGSVPSRWRTAVRAPFPARRRG